MEPDYQDQMMNSDMWRVTVIGDTHGMGRYDIDADMVQEMGDYITSLRDEMGEAVAAVRRTDVEQASAPVAVMEAPTRNMPILDPEEWTL